MKTNMILASVFPNHIMTCDTVSDNIKDQYLHQKEIKLTLNMSAKRKQSFTSGRLCARKALNKLGIYNSPILMSDDKSPIWPDNTIGCISHTKEFCGACAAYKSDFTSVGLDIERVKDIPLSLKYQICTPSEINKLKKITPDEQQKHLSLIFSAKETFYKYQYIITHQWVDFTDVTIALKNNKIFSVKLKKNIGHFLKGMTFSGNYFFYKDYIITGMCK